MPPVFHFPSFGLVLSPVLLLFSTAYLVLRIDLKENQLVKLRTDNVLDDKIAIANKHAQQIQSISNSKHFCPHGDINMISLYIGLGLQVLTLVR
jgi:hypothetical protein